MSHRCKSWLWALFAGYCIMMLWLLFLHRFGAGPGAWQFNLQPMDTVGRYIWVLRHSVDPAQRSNAMANLFGNVGLFVPLGIYLPMLFPSWRRFWRFLLRVTALILLVELAQAATGLGTCDVDDLILNFVGTVFGWILWSVLHKRHTCE